MSLNLLTDRIYERTKRVAPHFAAEFAQVQVPPGAEWVTAWDVATVAVTWEYHLSNGSRVDPSMIDGILDRETGKVLPQHPDEVQDLIAVFDRVRQNDEVRRDLRHLVRVSH